MKPIRAIAVLLAVIGLAQGCNRMPRRAPVSQLRTYAPDYGTGVVSPALPPAEGSGPIGGYRPSEGS
jgi:hypothetical protein